ncbi:MAG: hypothetical protein GX643_10375, partial [Acidimicrobiales bacterium]|nr:hypothetical protein [Acidimicrobiales bacterium]
MCSSKLPPRAEAWVDEASSRTVCLSCHRIEVQAQAAEAAAEYARNRVPVPDLNRAPRLRVADPAEPEPALSDLDAGLDADLAEHERLRDEAAVARAREGEEGGSAAAPVVPIREITGPMPKARGNRVPSEPLSAHPPAESSGTGGRRLPAVGPSLAAGLDVDRATTDP